MADFYLNNMVTLNPNTEILPLMGSKEGIMHISLALNEGDEVLIPNGVSNIYVSNELSRGCACYYDLKESTDWEPDFEALEN
jgi:aspartate/methionine/tyrosine aminotransferase